MATFITTIRFTDQGARDVTTTCRRAEDFQGSAAKMGVQVLNTYWTSGAFDGVLIFEAPDDETAAAAMLHLASMGNVHTQTVRAYVASEMAEIIGRLAR